MHYFGQTNCPVEWGFISSRVYPDPLNDVEADVLFTAPDGCEQRVPTFWAGEQEWRVRFAPRLEGIYRWRTVCTDTSNTSLHGVEGTLTVTPYQGHNRLLQRGGLQVSADRRYLQHRDGTPFLWLGDTWWMGLCKRLSFPGDFQVLTADRVQKGFTVIQIVAGLYPDMGAFDQRGINEAGFPWETVAPHQHGQLVLTHQMLVVIVHRFCEQVGRVFTSATRALVAGYKEHLIHAHMKGVCLESLNQLVHQREDHPVHLWMEGTPASAVDAWVVQRDLGCFIKFGILHQ